MAPTPSGGNGGSYYSTCPLPVSTKGPRGCGANSEVISPFPPWGSGANSDVISTVYTMGVWGQLWSDFHHFQYWGWGPTQTWFPPILPFPSWGLGVGANSEVISTNSTMGVGDQLRRYFYHFHHGVRGQLRSDFHHLHEWWSELRAFKKCIFTFSTYSIEELIFDV